MWPYWPTSRNDDDYVSFFRIWGLSWSLYNYDVFISSIFSSLWWCLINFLLVAFKISIFLSLPNSLQSPLISPRSPSSPFTFSCWSISPYSSIQSTLQPEWFDSASRILILCPLNWWASRKWKQYKFETQICLWFVYEVWMNPFWHSRYITENEKMLNKGERSGGQLAKRRLMFNSWLAATIRPCSCNFRPIQDIVLVSSFFLLEFILLSYQRST